MFVRWMYDAITESKFGIVWKVLVAYQKVVIAKEELAMERAIGTAFFSQGRFLSDDVSTKGLVINYGEGGLQNGKIGGSKLL